MIIKEDGIIRFVLESQEEFFFESNDRAIAEISVNGEKVPLSVEGHDGQFHVEAHPDFRIPGKMAFVAYDAFASSEDGLFGFWIDPSDGEVKVVEHMEAGTAEELDRVITEIRRELECGWDSLAFFADKAMKQFKEDREAYDMSDIMLGSLLGEED